MHRGLPFSLVVLQLMLLKYGFELKFPKGKLGCHFKGKQQILINEKLDIFGTLVY